jgi:hypothetical protein
VTADTSIPASALDFCEASGFTNSATCYAVNLFPSGPDIPAHTPELTFQLVQDGSVGTLYYYFPSDSSFAAFGTLTANFGNTGTLRISDTPEPPTGLLVLPIGFLHLPYARSCRADLGSRSHNASRSMLWPPLRGRATGIGEPLRSCAWLLTD